ncbi:protein zwilch-like [Cydia pomonella]|uniref:protein zwilch-like n=1 Tax=Cydia pomonella TaxID=82600 RepID=UPI002ADD5E74|nr:protein zwilch-like [Cydia pomonella]
MNTVLQPVLDLYPKYCIERQKCPSYVEMYTKSSSDVIMVYLKTKQNLLPADTTGKASQNPKEELDLTGSPLKLDLSLHTILDDTLISEEAQLWNKDESSHVPIGIDKAREIANLYNMGISKPHSEESIPMWIVCNPESEGKPLLLTIQSNEEQFARGIVTYDGAMCLEEVDVENIMEKFVKEEGLNEDLVDISVDCKYVLSGMSYSSRNTDELLNAPHGGVTELHCEWTGNTLITPFISCKVNFEQEVIVGHLASPCNAIWKSVYALHNINQILVDMTAAGSSSVNLETAQIRLSNPSLKYPNNSKRLNQLLNETEAYAYTAQYPEGGCVCVTENTTSLKQCLSVMNAEGSSNDFIYKLWDILRDCETAEDVVTLLLQALKFISSGKIRPFIDANNKTYLSKLVLKLSRGHSQASKVLKNLRASPPQALSLVAQVGTEKTMWEYTRVMSLLEHSFFIAGIWTSDNRTHESIEQINQTIQDMTMCGEFSLNPFETLSSGDHSIRLDSQSFYEDDPHELTVDDFASLKKHGLVTEKKDVNEVPLISDEIDISPWKNLLMKFAQVHVCLEHLYRAEVCSRADFTNLKPIAARLLEHYVSERSPVKTVGQLISDPVQRTSMPIANNVVQDHLKKSAFWYRMVLQRKPKAADMGVKRESKRVYVFTQLPVFPPSVWQNLEPPADEVGEVTNIGMEELKYHITKYTYICNKVKNKLQV